MMSLKDLLNTEAGSIALILGNGINRYGNQLNLNSWDSMLLALWQRHMQDAPLDIPLGISLTEFYDALDLTSQSPGKNLQNEFCELMSGWQPQVQHRSIMAWAEAHSVPVLTTNFDETLSQTQSFKLQHMDGTSFTDFYPWGSYFSNKTIQKPANDFAVWHINGIQRYSRSIRLGLSHYMGSVERARQLIHKGGEASLYANKADSVWRGEQTWLQIIFTRDLLFLGLGLDSSEVFLRWLLIERAKYFKRFPKRHKKAYYIYAGKELSQGQLIFLKSVGVEIIKERNYDLLYGNVWGAQS